MEMIDRYVYAVTRRLPAGQRADIERELRGLIEDMLAEERKNHPQASEMDAVETVLRQLGPPAILAARYRGTGQYLIGPDTYHLYSFVLRIVLIATGIGLTIALVIALLTDPTTHPLTMFTELLSRLVTGLIGAFGWVTLIFAAIERYSPEHAAKAGREVEAETFQPRSLPPVPRERDRISPADPIAAIIFTLIAMIAVFFVPRFVGLYYTGMTGGLVPLFNEPVFRLYVPFIIGILALGLAREIGKLAIGRWSVVLSVYHLAVSAIGVFLTIAMFSNPNLFNPDFFSTALSLTKTADPMILGLTLPQFLARLFIGLSIFGFVVDAITTVVRIIIRVVRE